MPGYPDQATSGVSTCRLQFVLTAAAVMSRQSKICCSSDDFRRHSWWIEGCQYGLHCFHKDWHGLRSNLVLQRAIFCRPETRQAIFPLLDFFFYFRFPGGSKTTGRVMHPNGMGKLQIEQQSSFRETLHHVSVAALLAPHCGYPAYASPQQSTQCGARAQC